MKKLQIKSFKRIFGIAAALLMIGVVAIEVSVLVKEYFRLNEAAKNVALTISSRDGYISLQESISWMRNYVPEDIQTAFFECDNDRDRKVDDPSKIVFPNEWLHNQFLQEFSSHCGSVGDVAHGRWVWAYTTSQASTYLTRLLGLKPYFLSSHLESSQTRRIKFGLVLDMGLFPKEGCIAEQPSCLTAPDLVLLKERKFPLDEFFLVPFGESPAVRSQDITCSAFLPNYTIDQIACHRYQEGTLSAAIARGANLLQAPDSGSVNVLIIITDRVDEVNAINMQSIAEKNIYTFRVIGGSKVDSLKSVDSRFVERDFRVKEYSMKSCLLEIANKLYYRGDK